MNTVTSYKIVWIDATGDLQEKDFDSETEARNFASTVNDSIIYRVQIIGSIERIS